MLTYNIDLDVSAGAVPAVIHLKQYQTDVQLVFKLYTTVGTLSIGSTSDCSIRGTKSDGNGFSASATYSSSNQTVTFRVTAQMTAVYGKQPFELTLTDSTGKMITATFYLDIKRAALDGSTVSASEIRELTYALDRTDEILGGVKFITNIVKNIVKIKPALLACLDHLAWATPDGDYYYDALRLAFDNVYIGDDLHLAWNSLDAGSELRVVDGAQVYNSGKMYVKTPSDNGYKRKILLNNVGLVHIKDGSDYTTDLPYYYVPIPNNTYKLSVNVSPNSIIPAIVIMRLEGTDYVRVSQSGWGNPGSVDMEYTSSDNLYFMVAMKSSTDSIAPSPENIYVNFE